MQPSRIASQEEWLAARRALLDQEKAHMRAGDALAAARRALPWVKVEADYRFDTAAGPKTLAGLFDGKQQLIVHHMMFAPEWEAGCPACTFQAEHIDGPAPHLEQHGVRILAVSRAPLAKLDAYKARMGWRFDWVSARDEAFGRDFKVAFTEEEVARGRVDYNFGTITTDPRYLDRDHPGLSVFARDDAGEVFHTYSTYARGLDALLGTHHYLDLTPEGRNDANHPDWPQRRDEY
ncbi:MAG TPA: DUF899 family protein [Caulobacteraceae bacterium]|jgi:predicted dithiol-disulfide oxidoreductase (DUF899 family)